MTRRTRTVRAQVVCRYPTDEVPWATLTTNALAVSMLTDRAAVAVKDGATVSIYLPDLDLTYSVEEYLALPWIQQALRDGDAV